MHDCLFFGGFVGAFFLDFFRWGGWPWVFLWDHFLIGFWMISLCPALLSPEHVHLAVHASHSAFSPKPHGPKAGVG